METAQRSWVQRVSDHVKWVATGQYGLARYLAEMGRIEYAPQGWMARSSASAADVTPWHQWCERKHLATGQQWRADEAGEYVSTRVALPELASLVKRTEMPERVLDLRTIDTLSSARASDLSSYETLDAFAEAEAAELIGDGSSDALAGILQLGHLYRLQTGEGGDAVTVGYTWDGPRLHFENKGGAYEIAAARYLARKLDHPVALRLRHCQYAIDFGHAQTLNNRFHLVGVSHDVSSEVFDHFKRSSVTFASFELPSLTLVPGHLLVFKRQDASASQAAEMLKDHGAIDIGNLLRQAAIRG